MASRALINLSQATIAGGDDVELLDPAAVRRMFSGFRGLAAIGRYDRVELRVDDRRALLSLKPLLAARLLARTGCVLTDRRGAEMALGWGKLAGVGLKAARDLAAWPFIRRRAEALLAELEAPAPAASPGAGPPLYLRADPAYGLIAGGSVSHSAGLLAGLAAAGLPPVVAATEPIPTAPAGIETLILKPPERFWPKTEWSLIAFNLDCLAAIAAGWRQPPPRFVCQRHALHAVAGLALARRFGVPFILEYNGPEIWAAEYWGTPAAEAERARRAERIVLAGADLIVAVSETLRQALLAGGTDAARIAVVPNGVDLATYRPDIDATALRRRYGLAGKTVIGFIGTFGPWHGVETLVEAFARLTAGDDRRDLALLLVGDGARMPAIRRRIADLAIEDRVRLAGLTPQEEGAAHIACFDIAVAPTAANEDGSPFFGSPTKLFEYLATGRAIVASALGQVAEMTDDETALLVPPGDAAALAAALARLVDDPGRRERMGRAARALAERRDSHVARARALLAHFDRTGGQAGGRKAPPDRAPAGGAGEGWTRRR